MNEGGEAESQGRIGKIVSRIVHAPESLADRLHRAFGFDRMMGDTRERRSQSVDSVVEEVSKTGQTDSLSRMAIDASLPEEEASEAQRRIEAAKWNYQTKKDLQKKGDNNE